MVKDSNIFDIDTPALLIDLDGVEKNLDTMQKKADASSALLRPHIKAHKIPELARTQVRLGAVGITASKVSEAEVMADAGIKVFALDKGAHGKEMLKGFGIVLNKKAVLERLSEEHGVMLLDSNEQLEIGETVRIIPNHACTVINLSDKAYGIRRGKVEAELLIAGRGKVQ